MRRLKTENGKQKTEKPKVASFAKQSEGDLKMSLQRDLVPDKSCLQRRLRLEAIFNSVSDGIIALDKEHQITSFN